MKNKIMKILINLGIIQHPRYKDILEFRGLLDEEIATNIN
jgi:hypothetical protein